MKSVANWLFDTFQVIRTTIVLVKIKQTRK